MGGALVSGKGSRRCEGQWGMGGVVVSVRGSSNWEGH